MDAKPGSSPEGTAADPNFTVARPAHTPPEAADPASTRVSDSRPQVSSVTPPLVVSGQFPVELTGRYKPLKVLGTGGMGCVFLVEDAILGREVALKQLNAEYATTGWAERFRREARITGRLRRILGRPRPAACYTPDTLQIHLHGSNWCGVLSHIAARFAAIQRLRSAPFWHFLASRPESDSCERGAEMSAQTVKRSGLSLVEVLVVISIIGTLAALLLPAVQAARSTASRIRCANNMRQLAVAAHAYSGVYGRLPVGCTMPYALPAREPSIADASGIPPPELLYDMTLLDSPARRNSDPIRYPFGPNWAVYLLPYIEQENLYRAANVDDYLTGYNSGNAAVRDQWRTALKDKVVAGYLCPADEGNAVPFAGYTNSPGPWARGNYAGNAGPGWWQMSLNGRSYPEVYGQTGPVFGINYGAVLEAIPDGTASTVLFTEVRVGVGPRDPRGVWALGYPGASITAANAIGDCPTPNDRSETSDDVQGCPDFYYPGIGTRDRIGCNTGFANLGWPSWQAQSRSRHAGGVNVALADGSVQFIRDSIDQGVWFGLLSANDGALAP